MKEVTFLNNYDLLEKICGEEVSYASLKIFEDIKIIICDYKVVKDPLNLNFTFTKVVDVKNEFYEELLHICKC